MSRILVAVFSASGRTKRVGEEIPAEEGSTEWCEPVSNEEYSQLR